MDFIRLLSESSLFGEVGQSIEAGIKHADERHVELTEDVRRFIGLGADPTFNSFRSHSPNRSNPVDRRERENHDWERTA